MGVRGFDSRRGLGIFFVSTVSRLAHPAISPMDTGGGGAVSAGVKRPGPEADYSLLLVTRSRMSGAMLPLHYVFMVWCLVKHTNNFTFIF
jgi:hypothetical protein